MAEKNILEIIITAKDQASEQLKGLGSVLGSVGKVAGGAALGIIGAGAAVGAAAFDLAKSTAPIEQVRNTFDNLTASIDTDSETMLTAVRDATRGMVSDADLMQASNKLMSMGLAGSVEEAAALAEMATQLGSAMGTDATTSMEDFALMLANQSIPRLDTFGISSGQVRTRIEELMAADSNLTREQAFMTATMEAGAVAMERVGEQSGTAQASMAILDAQMTNLKNSVGTALLPILTSLVSGLLPVIDAMQPGLTDAATVVGQIFAGDILPVLTELISALLPPIVELLPSITELFSLLATSLVSAVVPIIETLIGVLIEVIDMLTPLLEALLPPLIELIGAVLDVVIALLPVIVSLLGLVLPIIETILPPMIKLITLLVSGIATLVTWLVNKLQPAFDGISRVIQTVMGWIGKLTDKLSKTKLPDWLTPGSPTPFELGLRGISDALKDVDSEIGGLTVNAAAPMLTGAGAVTPLSRSERPIVVQLEMNSVVSLSDMANAERVLLPIIEKGLRQVMAR